MGRKIDVSIKIVSLSNQTYRVSGLSREAVKALSNNISVCLWDAACDRHATRCLLKAIRIDKQIGLLLTMRFPIRVNIYLTPP